MQQITKEKIETREWSAILTGLKPGEYFADFPTERDFEAFKAVAYRRNMSTERECEYSISRLSGRLTAIIRVRPYERGEE